MNVPKESLGKQWFLVVMSICSCDMFLCMHRCCFYVIYIFSKYFLRSLMKIHQTDFTYTYICLYIHKYIPY